MVMVRKYNRRNLFNDDLHLCVPQFFYKPVFQCFIFSFFKHEKVLDTSSLAAPTQQLCVMFAVPCL